MYQVVEKEVPPPSRLRADIPPLLDAVVLRALQKMPADRYQSAAEMADALEPLAREDGDGRQHVANVVANWDQARRRNGGQEPTALAVDTPLLS